MSQAVADTPLMRESEGANGATKAHRAYLRIRSDILTCHVMPGSKLNIAALASDLDVSLGAVREALSMLQSESLVRSEPQRGYSVSPVSTKELDDITEARIALEGLCLRASFANGDLTWESNLAAAWHRLSRLGMGEGANGGHLDPVWASAHSDFHASLVGACGNDWLMRMRSTLYEQSERYRRLSVPLAQEPRDVMAEHKALFEAAMNRDADGAVRAMETHLRTTAAIVRASAAL